MTDIKRSMKVTQGLAVDSQIVYYVESTINYLGHRINEVLNKDELQKLINEGITVTVIVLK